MKIEPGDIDLDKLFGVQLFLLADAGWLARMKLAGRALVSVFCKRPLPPPSGHGILFFNSSWRNDYVLLFEKAFEACRHPKTRWQLRFVWRFNREALLLFFSELPRWQTVTAGAGNSLAGRLFLYLFWVRCRQVGKLADRLSYKALAVVCDIQLLESFLVQVANRRGLPTITCQHGLYIDDGPQLLPGNLNPANYLNISSRYFLAWGEQTAALIERYCTCTCIVVGNPAIPEVRRHATDYFYVLTDADNRFRKYNERLLEIAAQISARNGQRYFVQFHPDNDRKRYGNQPLADEKFFPLANASFAIGHMTTQIFKAMRQGVPVYRLASTIAAHPVPELLLFSNAEELLAKSVSADVFEDISSRYIASIGGQSMMSYARTFDMVASSITPDSDAVLPARQAEAHA